MTRNPFLEGNYAPVSEEITAYDLRVEGAIPPQLSGRYIRTGPNPYGQIKPEAYHWFTGDGMVHGVELDQGQAQWYRNRWVRSPRICKKRNLPEVPKAEGGAFDGSGNTNVVHHAGKILAINEFALPYELSPELETVARINFGGPLPAGSIAHPKFDPASGEMFTLAYHFQPPFLRMHVIDPQGSLSRTVEIPVAGPVMVHDFALTENFVIFFDLPVVFNQQAALSGDRLPYSWNKDYVSRVGFMPKEGNTEDVVWLEVQPCYIFHSLNAYETSEEIVLDFIRHPKMFATRKDGPGEGASNLSRWRINRITKRVSETCVHEQSQEFPRADERLTGRQHRYGYCVSLPDNDFDSLDFGNSVLKHDLQTGKTEEHEFDNNTSCGEFVFVPSDQNAGEDEGWLMGYTYNKSSNTSDLLILDASHITNPPVARLPLPQRVPYGFHGNWIPNDRLGL